MHEFIITTTKMLQHKYNHKSCIKSCMMHVIILINVYLVTLNYLRIRKMEKQLIFSRLKLFKEDPQVTINICPTNKYSIKINNSIKN